MIKYFTIEDLLKHYLQKKFHILIKENKKRPVGKKGYDTGESKFDHR